MSLSGHPNLLLLTSLLGLRFGWNYGFAGVDYGSQGIDLYEPNL